MMIQNLKTEVTGTIDPESGELVFYSGYPLDFLFTYGWVVAIGAMFIGALITIKKWPKHEVQSDVEDKDKEVAQ